MIQIISYSQEKRYVNEQICASSIASPKSLDEFDVNIVDLRDPNVWCNNADTFKTINIIKDIENLSIMINQRKNTKIVVIVPLNQKFNYSYQFSYNHSTYRFIKEIELKNILNVLQDIIFTSLLQTDQEKLVFENTITSIKDSTIPSSFYFYCSNECKILTSSLKSEKATTIETEGFILTTLNLGYSQQSIFNFLQKIGLLKNKETTPDWFMDIKRFDDETLIAENEENDKAIDELKERIEEIKEKLKVNKLIESILYTNGNELVAQVYRILEDIFECDLSQFVDEFKEDFEIGKEDITYIGEIKGVTSNVNNAHISQLDVHVQGYIDKIKHEGKGGEVKGLLIINPQRDRSPELRDEIGKDQISLAKRNGSLIITTSKLLDLYETMLIDHISKKDIIKMFTEKVGLLD